MLTVSNTAHMTVIAVRTAVGLQVHCLKLLPLNILQQNKVFMRHKQVDQLIFCCAGVMCLDFHPQHSNLLALGCYDGSVNVYDVRRPNKPLYTSTAATGKHTDPVWEIFWQVWLNVLSVRSSVK